MHAFLFLCKAFLKNYLMPLISLGCHLETAETLCSTALQPRTGSLKGGAF